MVTKDVPANTIVAGTPAKPIGSIESYKEKLMALWNQQKPKDYFEGFEDGRACTPEQIHQMKLRYSGILRSHLTNLFWKSE